MLNYFRFKLGRCAIYLSFDRNFYRKLYLDVHTANVNPRLHFEQFGWKEGRNPNKKIILFQQLLLRGRLQIPSSFDAVVSALIEAPQLTVDRNDWIADQASYIAPFFDVEYYNSQNNFSLTLHDAAVHYVKIGAELGFDPCEDFKTRIYTDFHSHIKYSDLNSFFHALYTGKYSKARRAIGKDALFLTRSIRPHQGGELKSWEAVLNGSDRAKIIAAITPYFDHKYYIENNTDIKESGLDPILHYIDYGWRENRDPSAIFKNNFYKMNYAHQIPPGGNPLYHYAIYGIRIGNKPNPIGYHRWRKPTAPSFENWKTLVPASSIEKAQITVIIPVYRGHDDTLAAIYSVLHSISSPPTAVIVINDGSPESNLSDALRILSKLGLFFYIENASNIGFVKSINVGFAACSTDVILLNADTLVNGNWIQRLTDHAKKDTTIGTITPLSNNATICSYPEFCKNNDLALECSTNDLDNYAAIANMGRVTDIPTGVGFCLFVRRSLIEKVGGFDVDFGRGYGEENDFCMRAARSGFRNVVAEDIFVFHSGQVSFAEFRSEEYEPGQQLLNQKHPNYGWLVNSFVRADPLKAARGRLDLYRLAMSLKRPCVTLVGFEGSGGVISHIESLSEQFKKTGFAVVYATIKMAELRIKVLSGDDVYRPSADVINIDPDASQFCDFLRWLKPSIIHVHSVAHASWAAARSLLEGLSEFRSTLFCTLHDFDSLCHRHHMVNDQGMFCEKIDFDICGACIQREVSLKPGVYSRERIAVWCKFLTQCHGVFVPSHDTAKRLSSYFPSVSFKVRPHVDLVNGKQSLVAPGTSARLRVALIGAIGPHKGSYILQALALDARNRNLSVDYSVIGYANNLAELMELGVNCSGTYANEDECIRKLESLNPHATLFLSIWPETHLYTLSLAIMLGIPSLAFDIGAQAERLRAASGGIVVPYRLVRDPKALNDIILSTKWGDLKEQIRKVEGPSYVSFPYDYYDG